MISRRILEALPEKTGESLKPAIMVLLEKNRRTAHTLTDIREGLGGDSMGILVMQLESDVEGLVKEGTILKKSGPQSEPYYMLPEE